MPTLSEQTPAMTVMPRDYVYVFVFRNGEVVSLDSIWSSPVAALARSRLVAADVTRLNSNRHSWQVLLFAYTSLAGWIYIPDDMIGAAGAIA